MSRSIRQSFLPFALPDIGQEELAQIKEALESGWVTTGPKTRQFEREFAAAVGANYAVAVNSCTAAMHLALEAIGLKPGDEVITTPYTFAATAEVIRYFDATPVFVDVRAEDFNIDPVLIEQALTERTKAILPVHIGGLPAELESIYALAARHGVSIIEDAAHALTASYKDRSIGSANGVPGEQVSSAVCFSFYATKTITTGEGGMVTTDNSQLAQRCRVMALHGINHDAWKRYTAEGTWYYEIVAPGYKYNMNDISAAMGLAQLAKAEQMQRRRQSIAQRFNEAFKGIPALQIPHDRNDCQHAWHLYMLRLNLEQLTIDRAQFIEELKRRQIGASVHFIPLHLHPYYQDRYGYSPEDFPVSYREYQREVSLPIYSRMIDQDVDDVIKAVSEIAKICRKRSDDASV